MGAVVNLFSRGLIALALLSGSSLTDAQEYSLKEIPSAPGLTGNLVGTAINAYGAVAGWQDSEPHLSNPHVIVYSKGVSTDLGDDDSGFVLCGGIGGTTATGINTSGELAVTICATNELTLAGLWSDGTFLPFYGNREKLPAASSAAINVHGAIVGTILVSGDGCEGNGYHAFLYASGTSEFTDLGPLLGCSSHAYGINDQGQIVGYYEAADGPHAYVYSSGIANDLGSLGTAGASFAYGINANGHIAGTSNGEPFLYSNGSMQDIGRLSADRSSHGFAINASDEIVGDSTVAGGALHAFVYRDGTIADLNSLIPSAAAAKFTLTTAVAINDNGQIVANGFATKDATQSPLSFLLTPLAPRISTVITGTLGANGWYVGATTLTWVVTGTPAPTKSGCGKVTVPTTKGTTYTCSATNSMSSASDSITIKKDTVAPKATIRKPANGASYALNSKQIAAYTCTDATSGVATCTGTVADKSAFPTSAPGSNTFTVSATDIAGNVTSTSVTYTVN